MNVPLSIAAPAAAAAAFAYLDARYFLSYDLGLIWGGIQGQLAAKKLDKTGRHNFFYRLEDHALDTKTADRPLLIYEGREWTYRQFYDTVLRYGQWLKHTQGVQKDEIVALDCMNRPNFLFIWFGLFSIGAKVAFINYSLTGQPLLLSLKTSTARLLLVDEDVKECLNAHVMSELSSPSFREEGGSIRVSFFSDALVEELARTHPVREPDALRGGQAITSVAMLIYTSGTTGNPKPGIVAWNKLSSVTYFVPSWLQLKTTDRFYTAMPLYHSAGSVLAFCNSLGTGCTFILGHKFGTRYFWPTVRESKATVIQYVGETLRYLLAVPPSPLDKQNDVRMAFGNGLRPDIWDKVQERFGIEQINEFYAATEGTGSTWNRSRNRLTAGSIGRAGPFARWFGGRTMQIVEHDVEAEEPTRDLQTGFCRPIDWSKANAPAGELLYKLPDDKQERDELFPGYFRNRKATDSKIMRNVLVKGDSFFRTGDMVKLDPDGRMYFHDRIGDTFRWKSENVSTNQVAEVLSGHSAVSEANVYGVSIPNHDGRAGCVSIILKDSDGSEKEDGTSVDVTTLRELAVHASNNLPKYAVPVFLRFPRSMQRTGTNKQQKHQLRQQGVDWKLLQESGDKVFWLQNGQYVPYEEDHYEALKSGKTRV